MAFRCQFVLGAALSATLVAHAVVLPPDDDAPLAMLQHSAALSTLPDGEKINRADRKKDDGASAMILAAFQHVSTEQLQNMMAVMADGVQKGSQEVGSGAKAVAGLVQQADAAPDNGGPCVSACHAEKRKEESWYRKCTWANCAGCRECSNRSIEETPQAPSASALDTDAQATISSEEPASSPGASHAEPAAPEQPVDVAADPMAPEQPAMVQYAKDDFRTAAPVQAQPAFTQRDQEQVWPFSARKKQAGPCDSATDVLHNGLCYYLDGSGGTCDDGYELAPQWVLAEIGPQFEGKTYKHQVAATCCIAHRDEAKEGQEFGLLWACGQDNQTFRATDVFRVAGCGESNYESTTQLTFCVSSEPHAEADAELVDITGEAEPSKLLAVPQPLPALSRECYLAGNDTASRDAACGGNLVCAQRSFDGRDFGDCEGYHCCSEIPQSLPWAQWLDQTIALKKYGNAAINVAIDNMQRPDGNIRGNTNALWTEEALLRAGRDNDIINNLIARGELQAPRSADEYPALQVNVSATPEVESASGPAALNESAGPAGPVQQNPDNRSKVWISEEQLRAIFETETIHRLIDQGDLEGRLNPDDPTRMQFYVHRQSEAKTTTAPAKVAGGEDAEAAQDAVIGDNKTMLPAAETVLHTALDVDNVGKLQKSIPGGQTTIRPNNRYPESQLEVQMTTQPPQVFQAGGKSAPVEYSSSEEHVSNLWVGEPTLRAKFDSDTIDTLIARGQLEARRNPTDPTRMQFYVHGQIESELPAKVAEVVAGVGPLHDDHITERQDEPLMDDASVRTNFDNEAINGHVARVPTENRRFPTSQASMQVGEGPRPTQNEHVSSKLDATMPPKAVEGSTKSNVAQDAWKQQDTLLGAEMPSHTNFDTNTISKLLARGKTAAQQVSSAPRDVQFDAGGHPTVEITPHAHGMLVGAGKVDTAQDVRPGTPLRTDVNKETSQQLNAQGPTQTTLAPEDQVAMQSYGPGSQVGLNTRAPEEFTGAANAGPASEYTPVRGEAPSRTTSPSQARGSFAPGQPAPRLAPEPPTNMEMHGPRSEGDLGTKAGGLTAGESVAPVQGVGHVGVENAPAQQNENSAFPLQAALEPTKSMKVEWFREQAHVFRGECPSLFVAVMSRASDIQRRSAVRRMWKDADLGYGSDVMAKFAVCARGSVLAKLELENNVHRDLMLLDCHEGLGAGAMTQKVAMAMRGYLDQGTYELFMKTEDDTWVSTRRLCEFMDKKREEGVDISRAFMGVFYETGEEVGKLLPPVRDPSSPQYEPFETYPHPYYPLIAKGGPGYILPKRLVEDIIKTGTAELHGLNNEDKAVGVWVHELSNFSQVQYMNIPGTDGYGQHRPENPGARIEQAQTVVMQGLFGDYPYVLHHHLQGDAIACLHDLDLLRESATMSVAGCFTQSHH